MISATDSYLSYIPGAENKHSESLITTSINIDVPAWISLGYQALSAITFKFEKGKEVWLLLLLH